MNTPKRDTLRVPGANLYYEVRGSGTLLLMIAGGGGGGSGFNGIADYLADQYTVVIYDRRGAGQSTIDNPDEEVSIEMQSDDAHHLLTALTSQPGYVFGSSAGALIGLALVARHPDQVRTLVAHELPAHYLLPDEEPSQADPMETFRREGGLAALRQYAARTGVTYDTREPGVELPPPNLQAASAHADAFFKYTFMAVRRYRLDLAALKSAPTRIVVAGGSAGREYMPYRCALAVAECLGTTVVDFPSHHAGYVSHPKAFSDKLREVLAKDFRASL